MAKQLNYLKISGVQELLNPKGEATGKIEGTFVMTRSPAEKVEALEPDQLKALDLKPSEANTQLLFDDEELGVKFNYSRRWRVAVTGNQVTFEDKLGATALFTVMTAAKLPTAKQFRDDVKSYLAKEKLRVSPLTDVQSISDQPKIERFGVESTTTTGVFALEYAVLTTSDGGLTMAAQCSRSQQADVMSSLEATLKSVVLKKPVAK
jgi:hypothetical protein